MSDKFRPVQPGQPVRIPAGAWNAMLETARAAESAKFASTYSPEPHWMQSGICKVLNDTEDPLDRFAVVGIDGSMIDPEDNAEEFQARAAFRVKKPTEDLHGRWCVLTEPIPPGRIGRAWVAGVCPVRVMIPVEEHRYAKPVVGNPDYLASAEQGPAEILWIEPGIGEKWAVIRIGAWHHGPDTLWRFEITTTFDPVHTEGKTATADLISVSGGDTLTGETIKDPELIFTSLPVGARGLAIRQKGQYYVIQAACPEEEEPEE